MAVFTLFANMKQKDTCPKLIEKTAQYSFIIYMVHPFFMEKLNLIGITTLLFPCEISIPVLTIVIFGLSFIVGAILKKIPYIKNILV